MTLLDALDDGPLPASSVAERIGQSLEDTYALLVSAEARGDVRVITKKRAGMWRGEWESMNMGTPTTAMDQTEELLRQAGAAGMRAGEIGQARGINAEGTSRLMRRLMEAGRAARLQLSHRNVRYYATAFAPEEAERMAPKVKQRPPVPPKRVSESVAMQQTLAVVAKADKAGATIPMVCKARGCADGTAFKSLKQLIALGEVVNVRHNHRESRYYLPQCVPSAPVVLKAPPQRTTSVRDANVTMPPGEPIITPATKITRAKTPAGRFDFEPPKGWRGQITQDWQQRRLGAQGVTVTNVAFVVPGEPQGKGRARVGTVGGHARMFTPAKTVAYEGLISVAAQQAMGGMPILEGACAIHVTAVCSVPASWSKKKRAEAIAGVIRPTKKPDGDNVLKAVCDGINGVVWRDDVQAVDQRVRKVYGERPELRVVVARIDA